MAAMYAGDPNPLLAVGIILFAVLTWFPPWRTWFRPLPRPERPRPREAAPVAAAAMFYLGFIATALLAGTHHQAPAGVACALALVGGVWGVITYRRERAGDSGPHLPPG